VVNVGPPALAFGSPIPFRGNADVVKLGRTLFNTHCSHCHSPNAQNLEPRTDLRRLDMRYKGQVSDVFYTTVTQGRPTRGMPPWGEVLDEETIWEDQDVPRVRPAPRRVKGDGRPAGPVT
jgi:mono/diheme cytochrome c family protein